MMGPTDPVKAPSGTIRGDFGLIVTENLVHGSDSPDVGRPRGRPLLPAAVGLAQPPAVRPGAPAAVLPAHLAE